MSTAIFILVLIIFVGFIIHGCTRGFLRMALSMTSLILALVLVHFIQPYVQDALARYTPLESRIESAVYSNMSDTLRSALPDDWTTSDEVDLSESAGTSGTASAGTDTTAAAGDTAAAANTTAAGETATGETDGTQTGNDSTDWLSGIRLSRQQQDQWMDIAGIPSAIQQSVATTATETADAFATTVSQAIAGIVLKIMSWLLTFLIVFILLKLISGAIGLAGRLPVIHGINSFFGGVLGLIEALIVLWLLCLLLTSVLPSPVGAEIMQAISDHPFLSFLYEHLIQIGNFV